MNAVELQKAIYSRMINYSALTSLLATDPRSTSPAVYDHVPQDATFPYVVVGDTTMAPFDTDDSTGNDATVTIHVWSEYRGRIETKEIQDAIYNALHRNDLTVTGSDTIMVEWEYADSELDPDGITRHGVQRFRTVIEDS